jgi:hypothetical protein
MLVAAFVSSKSQAAEAASELLHASHCQTQAYAGHGTAGISLLATRDNFLVVMRDRVVGTDYSLCIVEEIQHPHVGREVSPFNCETWGK